MKSILIMSKVKNCYECPCSSCHTGWLGDIVEVVCQVTGEKCTAYDSERPDYCPLLDAEEFIVGVEDEKDVLQYH